MLWQIEGATMRLILVILALALSACGQRPIEMQGTDNEGVNVERLFDHDGCTDEEAREYLIAEEGDERDAIISYRTDRMEVAK